MKIPDAEAQTALHEARAMNSGLSPILGTRTASTSDQEFIFGAFKASMKDYVQWAWGWDEEVQRKSLLDEQNLAGFQLIMLHGEKIGALLLERSADQHCLRTIFYCRSITSKVSAASSCNRFSVMRKQQVNRCASESFTPILHKSFMQD